MSVETFFNALQSGSESVNFTEILNANPELASAVDAGGNTALHVAAQSGNVTALSALALLKPTLEATDSKGQTPLLVATAFKQYGAIRKLVEMGASLAANKEGVSPIYIAAGAADVEGLRLLMSLGAKNPEGQSALHSAVKGGSIDTVGIVLYGLGAGVDSVDAVSETALISALRSGKSTIVQFLLENGADATAVSAAKDTALHVAAEFATADDIRALVGFGASKVAVNAAGKTPLEVATAKGIAANVKELSRSKAVEGKEGSMRFKDHGNKVFVNGENMKAARFYTQAIQLDRTNHVFFSNRSACFFNQGQFNLAYLDACRCIALAPVWPKGYFRKAATEQALKDFAAAKVTVAEGLKAVPGNADLVKLQGELARSK